MLKKRINKIQLAICLLVIMMGVTGCMEENRQKEKMLEFMQEKYGERFTYLGPCEGQAGAPYSMIQVKSEKIPDAEIIVRLYHNEKEEIFQDNYAAYLLKETVEAEIAPLVQAVYGESKVFYKPAAQVLPEGYHAEMNADDFLRRRESMVHLYIYLPPQAGSTDKEERVSALKEKLGQKQYKLKALINYLGNNKCYEKVSEENYREIYLEKEQVTIQGIFLLEDNRSFRYLRWR